MYHLTLSLNTKLTLYVNSQSIEVSIGAAILNPCNFKPKDTSAER